MRTEFVRQEIDRRFGFRTLSMAAAALTACHFGQVAIPVPVDRPLGLLAIRSCVAKRNSSRAERAGKPTWTSQMTVSLAEAFRCKRRLVSIGIGHGVSASRPRATALPPIVSAAGFVPEPAAVCCIAFSRSCPDSGFLIQLMLIISRYLGRGHSSSSTISSNLSISWRILSR